MENPLISANYPITLKFEDIGYKIKIQGGGGKKQVKEKTVLNGITGAVDPGEILAILGPSGCGKTTLLTALGGRLGGDLTGRITYNGNPFSNNMNRRTGFVTQDDHFHAHLTVTETLVFTASLRLPNSLTQEQKVAHAEAVIAQLGLTKCKNNVMGGPGLRGVSGGERKRVSIGEEMLINPSLLFLDEPTSGLDSTSAQQVVSVLCDFAKGGRTVLMSIHQPSSRVFYMFHKILLLSDGNIVYFGKGETTMDYFASIGYTPSVAMNPAEFLLDLANGVHIDEDKSGMPMKQELISLYQTNIGNSLKLEAQQDIINKKDGELSIADNGFGRWNTTWGQQFMVLVKRDLKERKHESFSRLKITQILVGAIFIGLTWWRTPISHLQDQISLLYYFSLFWSLLPVFSSINTFPQERLMLTKERSSSMYRLLAYFVARTTTELPIELALPTMFTIITYFMGGLKGTASNFFKTLFSLLYSVLVSQGMGLAIGAAIMDLRSAITFASILVQMFLLVGGFYRQNIPAFLSWFKYISNNYYTFRLLLASQYESDELYLCAPDTSCKVGDFPMIQQMGLGNVGVSIGALAVMLVGYRVIAYVALMRLGRRRKIKSQ
ncbi:hypothetical protein C5167_021035 [Papaver somniferum]|uniref:ABC transporter domain-containing protein n=1 Tax=Papaver somniferum TaxID=3469 RepID=A0A4Y7IUQ2_PAPSO|nr:ABC transporter G family member 9-like [Papaver somniferum]RZC52613.1 hypothetical protein C5167_021035 [Papaver somniferum]